MDKMELVTIPEELFEEHATAEGWGFRRDLGPTRTLAQIEAAARSAADPSSHLRFGPKTKAWLVGFATYAEQRRNERSMVLVPIEKLEAMRKFMADAYVRTNDFEHLAMLTLVTELIEGPSSSEGTA